MKFLNLTLPAVAENLALDEALLESADRCVEDEPQVTPTEVLRIWEAQSTFIVVGRSSRVDVEVNRLAADELDVPIFRRVSGGTTIAAGPGCLFYSVLLNLHLRPHLRMLDEAHRFVMDRMVTAIVPMRPEARMQGTCDLVLTDEVLGDRKFSGNSLRVARNWMLYHGTLLVDMNLKLIARLLNHPPREPDYRAGRHHCEFLTNLQVDQQHLIDSLREVWQAHTDLDELPMQAIRKLVTERYSQASWNYQR